MRFIIIILSIISFNFNVNANNKFDNFFKMSSKNNNIERDFEILQNKGKILVGETELERKRIAEIQLSLEEAIVECIKNEICTSAMIVINTPMPATPLRITDTDVSSVSGNSNIDLNNLLLKRKELLLKYLSLGDNTTLLLSYKNNVNIVNNNIYLDLLAKHKNIIDCKGCYGFFEKIKESGAIYTIKTIDKKTIQYVINNNQFREIEYNKKSIVRYVI